MNFPADLPEMDLRCPWAQRRPELRAYHDREWGVPVRDDRRLFEILTLETVQSGLSWLTILKKRVGYREAFAGFDPEAVARLGEDDIERLLSSAAIIRHSGKVRSTIENARAILNLRDRRGSFADYVWSFVDGSPVVNQWRLPEEVPSESPLSKQMSRDMRKRGLRYVGPVTVYSFMQAAGLINDHLVSCPRHAAVQTAPRSDG